MLICHHYAKSQVCHEFESLRRQAFYRRLWCGVTGRRYHLLDLGELQHHCGKGQHHGGVQLVPMFQIRGSEGRSQDFDTNFCPLKLHNRERWVNIALARRADVALPLVELIQIGDSYYVRDGHHRISVAKAQGQLEIEAEVICWDAPAANPAVAPVTPVQPCWATPVLRAIEHLFVNLVTGLATYVVSPLQSDV